MDDADAVVVVRVAVLPEHHGSQAVPLRIAARAFPVKFR
jgi:hypothetical protein